MRLKALYDSQKDHVAARQNYHQDCEQGRT